MMLSSNEDKLPLSFSIMHKIVKYDYIKPAPVLSSTGRGEGVIYYTII